MAPEVDTGNAMAFVPEEELPLDVARENYIKKSKKYSIPRLIAFPIEMSRWIVDPL
ncbi:hypothetical protein ACV22X_23550 [Burkholderia orbicola]|uniref:hypothetical protein n=1 Tax=Burkholderia cenocepacia TaxID=95486 RepID=UPI0012BADA68|nr:hypothetical protein [Burkholderia cenocepacia]MBR8091643.1 hypothetical protein [Burkholderia cenocepacia]